jgi:putative hydrolase of the HAD superfamily
MIKTIIFDIGGVLVNLHFEEFFRKYTSNEALIERLYKATLRSPVWEEFDRGVLNEEEIIKMFMEQDPEIGELIKEVANDFEGLLDLREYAIPWIKELRKKGYKVLYLSNWPRKFHAQFYHEMRFIPYTDGGILSYLEKVIKPEPEIYELLMKRFDLKAEECVFMDDLAYNLKTAKELGMETILYTDQKHAIKELEKLGVY